MQRHAGGMNLLINYWLPHPFGIGRILHARGVLFHLSCSFLADRSASWLSCLFCDSSFSTCFKASSRCCWSRSTCACKFLISSCILLTLPFPFLAPGLYLPLFRFWSLLLLLPAIRRDKCLGVQSMSKTHWLIHKEGLIEPSRLMLIKSKNKRINARKRKWKKTNQKATSKARHVTRYVGMSILIGTLKLACLAVWITLQK